MCICSHRGHIRQFNNHISAILNSYSQVSYPTLRWTLVVEYRSGEVRYKSFRAVSETFNSTDH
jgi:hypothetical protein